MKILLLNGPNLNRLGKREPDIYGNTSMKDFFEQLRQRYPQHQLTYAQSNVEGELINLLQNAADDGTEGVVFNAGAYTHTSIALGDCIRSLGIPVIEVHISNVAARESYRHVSMIAAACSGTIAGFGLKSYQLAIEALTH